MHYGLGREMAKRFMLNAKNLKDKQFLLEQRISILKNRYSHIPELQRCGDLYDIGYLQGGIDLLKVIMRLK